MIRKAGFSLLLVLLAATAAQAQVKLGLKFSPALSYARYQSDSLVVQGNGPALRFIFGPVLDVQLAENYHFSTGLWFAPKQISMSVSSEVSEANEQYRLQYLQVPVTMKLFTDELALDLRSWVQMGAVLELNIHEEALTPGPTYVQDFGIFDTSVLLGAGVEYRLGYNTLLFGGFTYQRGLLNVATEQLGGESLFLLRNDLVGLDLGIKF